MSSLMPPPPPPLLNPAVQEGLPVWVYIVQAVCYGGAAIYLGACLISDWWKGRR